MLVQKVKSPARVARGKALAAVLPRAGDGKFLPLASRLGGPNVFQNGAEKDVFYDAVAPSAPGDILSAVNALRTTRGAGLRMDGPGPLIKYYGKVKLD